MTADGSLLILGQCLCNVGPRFRRGSEAMCSVAKLSVSWSMLQKPCCWVVCVCVWISLFLEGTSKLSPLCWCEEGELTSGPDEKQRALSVVARLDLICSRKGCRKPVECRSLLLLLILLLCK